MPSGAIKVAVSPASDAAAMLSDNDRSVILSVPPESITIVESSVPAPPAVATGIDWSTDVDAKVCGPVIEPVGPTIETTWDGVKLPTWIGRSKVTWNWLVVSLSSRLLAPVESWPEVPTAWVEVI